MYTSLCLQFEIAFCEHLISYIIKLIDVHQRIPTYNKFIIWVAISQIKLHDKPADRKINSLQKLSNVNRSV